MTLFHAFIIEISAKMPYVIEVGVYESRKAAREAILKIMRSHLEECPNDDFDFENLIITDPNNCDYVFDGRITRIKVALASAAIQA